MNYVGSKWYKCDLHLHTKASLCFEDQSISSEQWVQRAIEQGLNCVAVTDHNTGKFIDDIKLAAKGTDLTVFPGVEITCDTSKVHLLVLFDVAKTSTDVEDFIIGCGIDRCNFGEKNAHTSTNIFEIAKIAYEKGAMVIPAHIDEFNGLDGISADNLNGFFELPYINAVQVVHKAYLNPTLQINNNEELKNYLNDYYGNISPGIDYAQMADYYKAVKKALEKKLAIVTFSDNPHEPKSSKHGLDGIGAHYTWVKMDELPTLEGLRQAFLLPDFRVKNDFVCTATPYKMPELWIKSISAINTTITDGSIPLKVDFSPQLTTIIGGRGSGKSSVLRFIRGVFNRTADLQELIDILSDHVDFYKRNDSKSKKGVLTDQSVIEIDFHRNGSDYRITASNIHNSDLQDIKIAKLNASTNEWNDISEDRFIDFFEFEHYSQKQIYEIAQAPNSLRERIDKAIEGLEELKKDKEVVRRSFLEKSTTIRTIQQQVAGKSKLQTEIKDLDDRIKLFQQSGISALLTARNQFFKQNYILSEFASEVVKREDSFVEFIHNIEMADVDYKDFDLKYSEELSPISKTVIEGLVNVKSELKKLQDRISHVRTTFDASVEMSVWKTEYEKNRKEFDQKKIELEQQGINDIANFEKLTQMKATKEREFAEIQEIETNLFADLTAREKLQKDYLDKCKEITEKRRIFVSGILHDEKVKISIKPFRNQLDFAQKLRTILQKEAGFDKDIEALVQMCFNGKVELTIEAVRNIFLKIRRKEKINSVTGFFVNLVERLTDAQIDEIELMLPEDEIEVQYKPAGAHGFKPLATASAGQKTTAILTFILSHGSVPLILDQPEDDLDNRLVYELIVDRLRRAKETRQIIAVTHNANIPVNGDAEYIVSLNSESKELKVFYTGTVDRPEIKKEICDVMEGSEHAFKMRARRYEEIK